MNPQFRLLSALFSWLIILSPAEIALGQEAITPGKKSGSEENAGDGDTLAQQTAVPSSRDADGNPTSIDAQAGVPQTEIGEAERVIVTGTNIPSDSPPFVPESVFNRTAVDRAGSRSFGDFLQLLPQNSGPTFTENQNDSLAPGAAAVALRGLSPDATLVLVNSRRVAPYPFAQTGITAFVDLNSLPLAAIQQIDILRDGASAIYGTDAIAGVINLRLVERFDGALLRFGYGNTTDTDTSEYRASFLTGYTNERTGLELVAVGDYFHREALFQVDRYFSRSIDQRRQGGSSFLSSVANPGGVFDPVTGDPLRVPANSDGTPEVDEFLPGRNRFDRAPFQPLVPETDRYGIYLRGKVRVTSAVDLFSEFSYRRVETEQMLAPAPIEGDVEGISVPEANPFNPFGTDVVFRYRVTELGARVDEIESDVYRAVGGLNVHLPGRWGLETALLYSETQTQDRTYNNISRPALLAALADTNPATSFNVFGAGNNVNNPATIDSLRVTTTRDGESSLFGADARVTGPLFSLPAGDLLTAVGLEYRHEELSDAFDDFATGGGVIDLNSTSADGDRDVFGAYLELYVPLISPQMNIPGFHKLEGQIAVRYDDYSDFGDTLNPKFGLAWRPVADWVMLRASYSTGFRAPSLVQSSTGTLTFSQELQDTRRFIVTGAPEDESQSIQILSGGNPNLDAEDSENFSAGIVITPPVVPGLTLSADYFYIKVENAIASLDPQFILDNEGDFPGFVVRAPPSATDILLGIPGNVLLVNTSFQNLGFQRVEGIDAAIDYVSPPTRFGIFSLRFDMAYVASFEQQASDIEPVRELIDTFARPEFRLRTQLGWQMGGFGIFGTFNYIDSYEDFTEDRRVDYDTTFDLLVEYRFQKPPAVTPSTADKKMVVDRMMEASSRRCEWLDGLAVRVGVRNIFDDAPPFANNIAGYPVPLNDPRQRFVFIDIEKKF